jgi:hypothetical protein
MDVVVHTKQPYAACVLTVGLIVGSLSFVCWHFWPEARWETTHVTDKSGSNGAIVVIYSPTYVTYASPPDGVEILWDGEQVFEGAIPSQSYACWPTELLQIHTNPGTHLLEVKHADRSQREKVQLSADGRAFYEVFSVDRSGKNTLIRDLGPNPLF